MRDSHLALVVGAAFVSAALVLEFVVPQLGGGRTFGTQSEQSIHLRSFSVGDSDTGTLVPSGSVRRSGSLPSSSSPSSQ